MEACSLECGGTGAGTGQYHPVDRYYRKTDRRRGKYEKHEDKIFRNRVGAAR